jgi:hypothetical protein
LEWTVLSRITGVRKMMGLKEDLMADMQPTLAGFGIPEEK